ncbi:unnamed protein product, partial [Choristocarpus tenellus]
GGGGGVPKLLLMAPASVARWLEEYAVLDSSICGSYDFLDVAQMTADGQRKTLGRTGALGQCPLVLGPILKATSVLVPHCPHSYGLVLTVAAGATALAEAVASGGLGVGGANEEGTLVRKGGDWKLVYSGDCRPSDDLVDEGKGAALLIHEATFDETKRQ